MSKIRLADGTEFACDWCAPSENKLIFNLPEETNIASLVMILADRDKTCRMVFVASSETDYCGYTVPTFFQLNGWTTGGILVMMGQESD